MDQVGPEATLLSPPPPTVAGPSSWQADAADAARAAQGDFRAFERLYRAHVNRIHALARRMLSPDEANESTQDVFVRAWQKIGSYRGEAAFGTWLHRLAVNVLLSRRETLHLPETLLNLLPAGGGELGKRLLALLGGHPRESFEDPLARTRLRVSA